MIATIDLEQGLAALATAGISLPQDGRDKLDAYLALLAKWNNVYNLTAIRDPEQMITHHVFDALVVLPQLPHTDQTRVLDVGSGGGVPGIPLAIARPSWTVVLIDSNHKKGAFLQQAAIELGLANVKTVTARVEDYAADALFDVVISRAFSDLSTFAQSSARHLASGGRLYAMKGVFPDEEIAQLPTIVRMVAAPALAIPGLDAQRHLVVMESVPAAKDGA